MTVQFSIAVRNARISAIESTVGASPKLQLRTGAQAASCAAAASGTLLAELTLPSDWAGTPDNGQAVIAGSWSGLGIADGTVGHYRLVDNAGTTCHEQGSVGLTDSGEDLEVDDNVVAVDKEINITTWTKIDGNA